MKNKFKFLIVAMMIMCIFVATGCNLFEQNYGDYLNATVVELNFTDDNPETLIITREEYVNAYNNYGYQLIQQGTSAEDAKTKTIDALVNRKVVLRDAKKNITLGEEEKAELRYDTFEALINNAQSYEDAYKQEKGVTDAPEETEAENKGYKPYEKKAEVVLEDETLEYNSVTNKYVIKNIDTFEYDRKATYDNFTAIRQAFETAYNSTTSSTYQKVAYRRYLNSLKQQQELLKTNLTNNQLFEKEIDRIYKNLEENWYISQYQSYLTKEDETKNYSTITVNQVLDRYKTMLITDKVIYEHGTSYDDDMISTENIKNVNYYINDDYFFVSHILVKLSEAQTKELETLKSNYEEEQIGYYSYQEQKQNIFNNITATEKDENGNKTNNTINVNNLYQNLSDELNLIRNNITLSEKEKNEQLANTFKTYLYKYNEDDGIMNAEYPYVVGKHKSQMVESFTNASRELNTNGEFGAISDCVESEYGIHIIFYCGATENIFTIEDGVLNLTNEDIVKLDEKLLNPMNNKTVFDAVYESLIKDNYSILENMQIASLKSDSVLNYTIYKDNI